MVDLVLRRGMVVDGTGAPPRRADVAVDDGRIVAIGKVSETGRREIDIDGLVVAPGFIDPHTHYDAQVMWDPAATPSSLHGVTTVIGGNCGFTIAPMTPHDVDYLIPMLARVEGMPEKSLRAALDVNWTTFSEWLGRLDENVAVNVGFLAGHSAIRRVVMRESAVGEQATPEQIDAMVALLHESIAGGALGLSTTRGQAHNDHNGDPVPSRFASDDEILALCSATGQHPGTWLECILSIDRIYRPEVASFMAAMSSTAGRVLNWNLLGVRPGDEERRSRESKLAASDLAKRTGGRVVALSLPEPMVQRLSFLTGYLYETLPGWGDVMRAPTPEKARELSDPATRRRLVEGAATRGYQVWTDWAASTVSDVARPELQHLVGRSFGDIATERGVDPFDALCDVVLADGLATGIETPCIGDDEVSWAERLRLFRDDRVLVGGSDAGAHLDMMKTFAFSTQFLGRAVRDRGLLPLEEAVHLITDAPARLFGLRDRGRIAEGWFADLVVFDPATVARGPIRMVDDLPANGERLTADAIGIERVFVNGTEIVAHGQVTGATPGVALRSGRDTDTVAVV